MSREVIDERVVSMQFDNRNFEKNVSTSIGTLDKLKQSLQFKGATRGLEEVNQASKKLDFRQIENTACQAGFRIQDVWLKVASVFEYQIAGRIINIGKRMVSAFTIDPVKTGLSEYETQMGAIQTILSNTKAKGTSLEDVNAALDELNMYADKTIYNFTEMTKNIGTFTAAGVGLEDSVSSIKGIANLAAISGSTSQQASTAMYQLSQALASGTIRLMDWNSVVNAGMGGEVFQNALKETAKVHGVAIDDMIKKNGSFRESLKDEWLTSEILLETLSKFTGDLNEEQLKSMGYTEQQIADIIQLGKDANDAATKVKTFTQLMDTLKEAAQSGWAQTWRLVVGDFEEAREMWTSVSDVLGGLINQTSEARNQLLSGTLTSGWDQLLGAGIMDEEGYSFHVKKVAKEHGIAIDEMIEEEGSLEKALRKGFQTGTISSDVLTESLKNLTTAYGHCSDEELKAKGYTREQVEALKKLNEQFQNGEISIDEFTKKMSKLSGRELILESFGNIYKALVSIITPIKEAFREIFPKTTSDQLYSLLEGFRNFTKNLILTEDAAKKVKTVFKGLFAAIDIVLTIAKRLVNIVWRVAKTLFGLGGGVLSVGASFGELILRFRDAVKESTFLTKAGDLIVLVFAKLAGAAGKVGGVLKDFAESVKDKFGGVIKVFKIFGNALKKLWNFTKNAFSKMFGNLFESVKGSDPFEVIKKALEGGLIGALISLVLKIKNYFKAFEGIGKSWSDMAKHFNKFIDSLSKPLEAFQQKIKAQAIKEIATAVAILVGSIVVLALIDQDKIMGGIMAIGALTTVLVLAMNNISKIGEQTKAITSSNSAVEGVKTFKEKVKDVFSSKARYEDKSRQLIAIAASLLILSFALAKLSKLSWSEMARGLVAMGTALGIMVGVIWLLSIIDKDATKIGPKGTKLFNQMAISLLIIAGSLKVVATMSWTEIGKGLTAMGGAFGIMVGTLALLTLVDKKEGSVTKGARLFTKMAKALLVIAGSLKVLATMSWSDIGRSLTAMGGALAIMSGVLALLSLIKVNTTTLIGFGVITVTLMTVAVALKVFASMSWTEIGKGLIAMSGALGILAGVMLLVSNLGGKSAGVLATAGSLMLLAGAMAVLVSSVMILGQADIGTLVKGLVALAAIIGVVVVASLLLKTAAPGVLAFAGALALFGVACIGVGAGIALLCLGISALITAFATAGAIVIPMILELAEGLIKLIPLLVKSLGEAFIALAQVIRDGAPVIGEAVVSVILSILDAAVKVIPELASGIVTILLGVFEVLVQHAPTIINYIFDFLIGVLNGIASRLPELIQATMNIFMAFFQGVVDALKNIDTKVLMEAITGMGLIAALIAAAGAVVPLIPVAMVGVLGMGAVVAELAIVLAAIGALANIPGLQDLIADGGGLLLAIGTAIGQFIGGVIGGIAEGAMSTLPTLATHLSGFMINLQPFLDGLKYINHDILESGKTLVSLILVLTAANLIDSLTSWLTGGVSLAKFGSELGAFGSGIKQFANEVKGIDCESVKSAAEAGKNLGQMAKAIPTSGGLWDLIAGKNDLKKFANELGYFGKGVKTFANEVKGLDGTTVEAAASAGLSLAKMAKEVPTSGGLWNLIAGKKDLSTFADQLKYFGVGIKNLVKEISSAGDVNGAIEKIQKLSDFLNTFSTKGVESITKPFESSKTKLNQAISEMVNSAISTVESKTSVFATAGKNMMIRFIDAVLSCKEKVIGAFKTVVNSAIDAVNGTAIRDKFYNAGKYAVQGYADGISENTYLAEAKATAMAQASLAAARTALDINSPSKKFGKIGEFAGLGYIKSLDKFAKDAYTAGSNMAKSSLDGVKRSISKISDIISSDVETQPTITPVLNLDNISSGIRAINGMFGLQPSVGVLANVGGINSSMRAYQNGKNDPVVSAISDLKKSIKESSGDTYQINGVSYDAGSDVAEAIAVIARAAKIEGRM